MSDNLCVLHVASIAAFFIQQNPQTQCVVQCEAQSSIWMRLLVSAFPSLLALGVAWFAFWLNSRWNRKQWILDQKKAEWSALLRSVANVFHIANFNTLNGWNGNKANRIATGLGQALEEISIACANCIFLDNFRQNRDGDKKIKEFIKKTELQAQKLKGNLGLSESLIDKIHNEGSETDKNNDVKSFDRNRTIISNMISDLAEQSRTLLDWLQNEAALDLCGTAKGKEHQTARRWTKLFNFTRKKTGV